MHHSLTSLTMRKLMTSMSLALITSIAATNGGAESVERVSSPGKYAGYSEARFDGYQLTSQYVAVRDGTKLAVDILRPTLNGKVTDEKLPVLWMHTPYNRRTTNYGLTAENYPGKAAQLVKYGYVVATVDFRGLYASYGQNKAFNRGEWLDAARFDAYDITEWFAKQPWSTGKVGMWGCSATGGSQMQALSTAPPSLKAIFPMSCEWDVYPWVASGGIVPPKGEPTQIMRGGSREERDRNAAPVDNDTDKSQMQEAIAQHENNLETSGYVPFRDSVAENFPEQWWLKSSPYTYAKSINGSKIAVYAAGNWDEGGTKYGVPFTYNNLQLPKKMIFGPAHHCDWGTVLKETGFDIVIEEHRFFDYWLKGIDNGVMKEAPIVYYTYNQSPDKLWQTTNSWPLPNEHRTTFYLDNKSLGSKAGAQGSTEMQVRYDVNDKTFADTGMIFVTEPLADDTQVTGSATIKLWLSSSSNDADVIARIDDVAPDGTARYYNIEGKLRASMRKLGKAPYNNLGLPWHPFTENSAQPLVPNEIVQLEFDFLPISYMFPKGHRIRLTMNFADARSTPRLSPAPQVNIYHGGKYASALTLPIIR
jgi:predicted acyl esterase